MSTSAQQPAINFERRISEVETVSEVLSRSGHRDVRDLAESLHLASTIIKGQHETGLETDLLRFKMGHFLPDAAGVRQRNIARHLFAAATDTADLFVAAHEEMIEDVHARMSALITNQPGMLFVGRARQRMPGKLYPVVEFETVTEADSIASRVRPIVEGRDVLWHYVAYCDIDKLPAAAARELDTRIW